MNFPPIKIVQNPNRENAHNGPTGVTIDTGTRYFAAVLLQEAREGLLQMLWFWGPPILIAGAAFLLGQPLYAIAAIVWMMLVAFEVIPFRYFLERRELRGQATEIAAIKLFYARPPKMMEAEYYLQARSIIRQDSSYVKKGFFKKIGTVDPSAYRAGDAAKMKPHAAVEAMIELLKSVAPEAEKYVLKKSNWKKLEKWRALGAESKGY
jgi:hypothetical protein